MNTVKVATAVVVFIVTLAGALWGLDATYLRVVAFNDHVRQQTEDDAFRTQQQIWGYQDQIKKNPKDEEAKKRLRELEYKKMILDKRLGK